MICASLTYLLLAACEVQIAPTQPSKVPETTTEPGTPSVAEMRSYQGVKVPLPRGQWQEIGEVFDNSYAGFPQKQVVYASYNQNVIDRLVTVWWQDRTPPDWFTPFAYCEHRTYPYSAVFQNYKNNHACWHVRPVNLGLAGNTPTLNAKIAEFARRNNLFLPVTMIGVRFVETSGTTRHYIEYLWNMDLILPREDDQIWRPSDWNKNAIATDPRREAAVRAFVNWGQRWRQVAMSR